MFDKEEESFYGSTFAFVELTQSISSFLSSLHDIDPRAIQVAIPLRSIK